MNYEKLWTEHRNQVQNWCENEVAPIPVELLRDLLDEMDTTEYRIDAAVDLAIKQEREAIREEGLND